VLTCPIVDFVKVQVKREDTAQVPGVSLCRKLFMLGLSLFRFVKNLCQIDQTCGNAARFAVERDKSQSRSTMDDDTMLDFSHQ